MNHCDFYQSTCSSVASKQVDSSHQQHVSRTDTVVWCSHKHSPSTEDLSRSVFGGGRTLVTCGGDFDKCTISSENFMDVIPD